jgi:hypothetical protein
VLIPKPENQGFRGIALLETIYRIISMIIHIRLTTTINLHDLSWLLSQTWNRDGNNTSQAFNAKISTPFQSTVHGLVRH